MQWSYAFLPVSSSKFLSTKAADIDYDTYSVPYILRLRSWSLNLKTNTNAQSFSLANVVLFVKSSVSIG